MLNVSFKPYIPSRPLHKINFSSSSILPNHDEDIKGLQTEFVNNTTIKAKLGKVKMFDVPVEIHKVKDPDGKYEIYYITGKNKKNILGKIALQVAEPTIIVMNLDSYGRRRYSGIGSRLIQIALEKSMEPGHNKRIELAAKKQHLIQHDPSKFYERVGFIPMEQDEFDQITYGKNMYLALAQEHKWLERIEQHPLLK